MLPGLLPAIPAVVPVKPGVSPVLPALTPASPDAVPAFPGGLPVNPAVVPVNPDAFPVNPEVAYRRLFTLFLECAGLTALYRSFPTVERASRPFRRTEQRAGTPALLVRTLNR